MPNVTFYANDHCRAANGLTYSQNVRRGLFCAANEWRLGTRLELTSRGGRRVFVTVADRIGHGSDCDLSIPAARAFMGSKFRIIGRMTARIKVVAQSRKRNHRCRQ